MTTKASRKINSSLGNIKEGSQAASTLGNHDAAKRRNIVIWPEWNEAELATEKWDVQHRAKEKTEKGTKAAPAPITPQIVHFFDDPEGRCELPGTLKVAQWKRPQDFITDKVPVVVDVEGMNSFDLLSSNDVVHESETMRWITSQITSLWNLNEVKVAPDATAPPPLIDPNNLQEAMFTHSWRPWEHIYAMAKTTKGVGINYPQFNPYGKYIVKLYWMGCWRKLIVDDCMPFDEHGNLLLPSTTLQHELWPMLLTKALLKVAALDASAGGTSAEFGDFSAIHCLTGWLPEVIPLQHDRLNDLWTFLKTSLSEFTLPEPPPDPSVDSSTGTDSLLGKEEKVEKERSEKAAVEKAEKPGRDSKDKKGKDDKKKKDKEDAKLKAPVVEEQTLPEHPEVIVFAAYQGVPKSPARITLRNELANTYEMLNQQGFSHCYPHPVLVSQTRSCPLQPPPPQEKIPAWKTIRPRKKADSDDSGPAVEKPIQCVRLFSPFLNYKLPLCEESSKTSHTVQPSEAAVTETVSTPSHETLKSQSVSKMAPKTKESAKVPDDLKVMELKNDSVEKIGSGKKRQKSKTDLNEPASPEKQPPVAISRATKRASAMAIQKPTDAKSNADAKTKPGEVKRDGRQTVVDELVRSSTTTDPDETLLLEGLNPLETEVSEEKKPEPKINETWLDFDVLCKCFRTLIVYHKPNTYPHNHRQTDLKAQPQPAAVSVDKKADKKAAATTASAVTEEKEKSPYYLFVDSLKPTDIVVSFSALCHWNDPPPTLHPKEETKPSKSQKDRGDRESRMDILSSVEGSGSSIEQTVAAGEPAPKEPLHAGVLLAEPISWKSLATGQPVLRIRTTGTRASVLSLPEGRHILRFSVVSPLGYQLHLCSTTSFVFGDEEKVIAECTKESSRFMDSALQAISSLGKCLLSFNEPNKYEKAVNDFTARHCPFVLDSSISKKKHHQVMLTALYASIRKILTDAQLANQDMSFAWRVFNFDATTRNPLGLPHGIASRPTTGATSSDRASSTGGKKTTTKKRETAENKADAWKNREITDADHAAATSVQSHWRGYYVRKITAARRPGSEERSKVQEQLTKAWAAIEPLADTCGSIFLRTICRLSPEIVPKYPFYKDEWNRVALADYQGNFPEHPMNTWFLVFRDVFHVTEDILCVPKVTIPLASCSLRVINNDTGEEIPRVFGKVSPYVYKRNRLGYTFVADAKTSATLPSTPGHWRMRLIGSAGPLPLPSGNEVNSSFNVLELHEHYVPNEKNIIFRYCVRVTQDHLASIQMSTSKADVQLKLSIIDGNQEVVSREGIGHVVLPSFIFHRDPLTGEEELIPIRSNARSSARASRQRSSQTDLRKSSTDRYSPRQSSPSPNRSTDAANAKSHKYYVQAAVLNGSWPLSQAQWAFVETLKENEMNEQKDPSPAPIAAVERSTTPVRGKGKDKTGRTNKTAAASKEKEKEKQSKTPASLFNDSMPNWTLRIVSDADLAETIEVKKDTERRDAIKAMKLAWEDAEPGRAAKAKQARLCYLESHAIKQEGEAVDVPSTAPVASETSSVVSGTEQKTQASVLEASPETDGNAIFTNIAPPPKKSKEQLVPLDLTPFLRKTIDESRLLDEEEIERQMEQMRNQIQSFRQLRAEVGDRREQERRLRNALKAAQIKLYEQMQVSLYEARVAVKAPHEAYRQRLLELERQRLEAATALEAAQRAEHEKPANDKKTGQKSPRSPGTKKKR